jgi:hypothetical protein
LLTKFGLTQFTASFRSWIGRRCIAFDIFDALAMHTIAAGYSGPIKPTTTAHVLFSWRYSPQPYTLLF